MAIGVPNCKATPSSSPNSLLLMAFLGRENEERIRKAARYILTQERPDGGWSNYPGGPVDINVSVKAYFALKLAGHHQDEPYMRRACTAIRSLGGAACCNSFSKFYLALAGPVPLRQLRRRAAGDALLAAGGPTVNIYAYVELDTNSSLCH